MYGKQAGDGARRGEDGEEKSCRREITQEYDKGGGGGENEEEKSCKNWKMMKEQEKEDS